MDTKPVHERVRECSKIVAALDELGIPPSCTGRTELRTRMNDYIRTGEAWAGNIPFHEYKRTAQVIFPRRRDRQVVFHLLYLT